MTRNFILLLFFILTNITAHTATAQQDNYTFFNYTSDNGLPQNSVKSAVIDKNGYLWLATEMGLVRFDGSSFLYYNRSNSPHLHSNRIRSVGLLDNGELYCVGGGFGLYYLQNGTLYWQKPDAQQQLAERPDNKSLYNIAPLLNREYNKELKQLIPPLEPTQFCYYLPVQGPGERAFIFAHRRHLSFISGGKVQWIDSIADCRPRSLPTAFTLGPQCYYINRNKQLIAIDTLGHRYPVEISGPLPAAWKETVTIEQINLLPFGNKMFLHCLRGIYRLERLDEKHLQSSLVLQHDYLSQVSTFLQFPDRSLFLAGTLTRGMALFRKQFFHTEVVKETDLNNFYAQTVMDDGRILTPAGWIGADHSLHPLPFPLVNKKSMLRDDKGHFWINAEGSIYELDREARPLRRLKAPPMDVNCFYQAQDKTIWICAYVLLHQHKPKETHIARLVKDSLIFLEPELAGAALIEHAGRLWVGCSDGLKSIDPVSGAVSDYPFFKDKEIRGFYRDRHGVIWIGTNGSGFFAFRDNHFFRMPPDRNNYLATAHAFVEDNKGFLWISTNKGLFQMLLSDLYAYLSDNRLKPYYHYYDKTDGFRTNEFNGGCTPASIRLPDGRFSLPSLDGLVQFYPEQIRPLLPDKPIFFDWVKADTQRRVAAGARLPSSLNHLDIKISSPYFGNPYNQQLEYNLKGLDDNWYPVNDNNIITFNQLSKGNYRLQVRKKPGFGAQYITAVFPFSVAPSFTETLGFKIGLVLLIFILAYLFLQLRYRYVIRQRNKLQREVAYHTREQKRLIDELYFNSKIYRKISQVISHDLRSPLRFLHLISRSLPDDLEQGDPAEISKSIGEIKTTSGQVVRFVEDFHLWVSSFNASFEPDNQTFPLAALITELQEFFGELLLSRNNTLVSYIRPEDYLFTDRQLLKIILRNLVDNANKYTAKGTIRIDLETQGDHCTIKVQDNGKGIPAAELQKIQQRIEQAYNPTAVETDGKLGYQIIIDFVRRLDARISLQSEEGKGTVVSIEGIRKGHPAAEQPGSSL